jgi:endo-1,4-beta-xylanase
MTIKHQRIGLASQAIRIIWHMMMKERPMRKDVSRREFISTVGTMGAGALALRTPNLAGSLAAGSREQSLRDLAASRGLLYGAATQRSILAGDPQFAAAFAQQCGMLVPENELKWDFIRPTPETYNFDSADWLYNFTQQHQMKFRGHTLAWNKALPPWFNSYANPENARQLLLGHIGTVVGRYAGKMQSWDVLNEAIEPGDKRPDGLRSSPWLELLGPEYIDMAFYAAAEADAKALLVWNEIHMEFNWARANRQALIQNLQRRIKRGVPIHAVGLQSHLWANVPSYGDDFPIFLQELVDMGLKIMITEMDVMESYIPGPVETRDKVVAGIYYDYLSTVLSHKSVVAVLTWGLSDRYTYLTKYKPRSDGGPVRPLPLDSNLNPKPAWYSVVRAFNDEASAH